MKTVVAIHTGLAMVDPSKVLFKELIPEVRLINMVDESLIQDVIKAGTVTPAVAKRLVNYYHAAVDAGADLILNTCSSVGEIAEMAQVLVHVPILRVDLAMATQAVEAFGAVAVLATLPTTLGPTARLIQGLAAKKGKKVLVKEGLADGAFQALMGGDPAKHDSLIEQTAAKAAKGVDAFVLAQGSMARMEKTLADLTGKPVLSSPRLGVLAVKAKLAEMA